MFLPLTTISTHPLMCSETFKSDTCLCVHLWCSTLLFLNAFLINIHNAENTFLLCIDLISWTNKANNATFGITYMQTECGLYTLWTDSAYSALNSRNGHGCNSKFFFFIVASVKELNDHRAVSAACTISGNLSARLHTSCDWTSLSHLDERFQGLWDVSFYLSITQWLYFVQ